MASSKQYLTFLLEQLSELEDITSCPMMGEFLLYYRGKLVGGIYDNRLLLKPVPSAIALLPTAPSVSPYPGAKEMLLVESVEDRVFLSELFHAIYPELPVPKPKRKR